MTSITPSRAFLVAVLGVCLQIAPAHAASSTFVSAVNGSNSNDCSRAAPCRTLARAMNHTSPGGEIKVLDPGDYGFVTIQKAISIVSEGPGEAAILVPSGGTGVAFLPLVSSCLVVSNTVVTNVGSRGIHVNPPSGVTVTVKAVVHRSQVHNGTDLGIFAQGTGSSGTIDMTVSDSVASGHPQSGIRANSLLGATTTLSVIRSVSVNNGTGISAANANATVRVAQSMVTGNTNGLAHRQRRNAAKLRRQLRRRQQGNQGAMPLVGRK
ncbi:MAG: right-handed parallel beta-helix repeat-containing protein [Candidatus Rokubacteria bacterium]|nr:right-handed parallel beta-helix repeat-containing protein [Candidatus Rokubacteria bacterium]